MTLVGKVAVITGGTSGIGARIAEVFVSAGARVVIAGMITGQDLVVDGGISAGWPITAVRPDRELFFHILRAARAAHPVGR